MSQDRRSHAAPVLITAPTGARIELPIHADGEHEAGFDSMRALLAGDLWSERRSVWSLDQRNS
jgi:hypothetical protein